ncbi:MAG TPA: methyltransferase domain-containing protein, partial [Woeseiaceae bacterium]|nr:methyltransferase domain-containing protein [Woeseiaceae bacterium]
MARARQAETARIGAVTHDGRGIAAVDGKKVFVAGALRDEEVRFLRRKRRRNYDEAQLLEVLDAAASRVTPRCAVFGTCGGCSLQHQSAAAQRAIKEDTLRDSLQRIGGLKPARWLAPLYDTRADGDWHYRRRARLAVKDVPGKGRVLVGFRERHAPFVADMHRCEILVRPLHALLDPLSELVGALSIRSRVPQIEVAAGDEHASLVFRVLDPPSVADRERLANFARQHALSVALQPGGPDSVEPLFPPAPPPLTYRLPEFDLELEFGAMDFVQVNAQVNRHMVSRAVELLAPTAGDRVLDLYCGIGNFSLPLARRAADVLGIEGDVRQVQRAAANARRNALGNARFQAADLAALDGSEPWLATPWTQLLLDPARNGAAAVIAN